MVRKKHFAVDDIKDTIRHLNESYNRLKDLSSLRKLRLNDAVESQQFYFRLNEAFDWIQEKKPILKVRDIKNDEDSVQIYLKEVNDVISDTQNYKQKLNEMRISSEKMVEREHLDSQNIQEVDEQKQRSLDQKAVIEFLHETGEVNEWLNTQEHLSAKPDI